MKAVSRVVIFILLAAVGTLAGARPGEQDKPADSDWVAQKTQTCAGCHGKKGVSQTAQFPVLAGQYQNYLLHALKAYRDGGRKNVIMSGQVKGLTDAQLKALASYFSNQESPLHTPRED